MKYLTLLSLLLSLVACSKKETPIPIPPNMSVHVIGKAPMIFIITQLPGKGFVRKTLDSVKLNTDSYDYSFHVAPGNTLEYYLDGPKNAPLSFNVEYNGNVVVTESNANFPDANIISNGYIVPTD